MKLERCFLFGFCIISFLLIAYGFYVDIITRTDIGFFDILGIMISLISSVLGVIFVVYGVLERKAMFLISIFASSSMILYLWFWSPLIWDFVLSIGYLCISIYALYYWSWKGKKEKVSHLMTQILSWKGRCLLIIVGSIGTYLLSFIGMKVGHYTSLLQAISDAFTTVLSIIGQILLSRKYLEAWYMWIVTNTVSIPLYISISSYTYAALFFCYLVISFYGLYIWKQKMKISL